MSKLERCHLSTPSLACQEFALVANLCPLKLAEHTAEQQAKMASNAYRCRILLLTVVLSLLVIVSSSSSRLTGSGRPPNCPKGKVLHTLLRLCNLRKKRKDLFILKNGIINFLSPLSTSPVKLSEIS
jgi:hypothetical protein